MSIAEKLKSKTAAPDVEIARAFVAALAGSSEARLRFRLVHDQDRKRPSYEFAGTLDECWPDIIRLQADGYGCFYFLNEVAETLGGGRDFAKDEDVVCVRALAADFDPPDTAPTPEVWEWHQPPNLLVLTSLGHAQALWLAPGLTPEQFTLASRRLIDHYRSDPAVKNLSRILRLPGTLHLKHSPQLVTFENLEPVGEVLDGLPEIPAAKPASSAVGDPVDMEHLKNLLSFLDPDAEYPLWRDCVAAIHATNAGTEHERHALAIEWSRGDLLAEPKLPSRWDGEDAVERVWETMPPRAGGVSYGSLLHAAKASGYEGNSAQAPSKLASEVFAGRDFSKYLSAADEAPAIVTPDEPIPFSNVLTRTPAPLRELVPGLIERGTTTFLAGPGGVHKSRLALQLGMCIAAGNAVFGKPVEPATFIYLSYEDHADEVTRRVQAIGKRLKLPADIAALYWDLTGTAPPLAIVGDAVDLQPMYHRLIALLKATPGHKFVVADSTYNVLQFTGAAKINETSVKLGIEQLNRLCAETDTTLLALWHPSQAGQERGDASGWSVAWHNSPRARLSLSAVKDTENAFDLKVEKRNNGPKPKQAITLHWSDGALLPLTETATAERQSLLADACVDMAIAAASQGAPITSRYRANNWVFNEIEQRSGYRLSDRELKEQLATAMRGGKLRYQKGRGHDKAGYFPPFDAETAAAE